MKKLFLTTTILGSATLISAMGLAQAQNEPDATQAQDACTELIAYMEEEDAQATELTVEEAEALQAQGDTEACRDELERVAAADDGQQQATARQDQPTEDDEFAEGEPTDPEELAQGQPDDTDEAAQQPDGQETDEGGRIVVERDAPSIDVEQAAPEVAVEQPQPRVTVRQPQPEIEVRQPAPTVTVDQPDPEITVRMPEPEVEVTMPEPRVAVEQPQPEVEVRQPEEPDVQVQEEQQAQIQSQSAQQAETTIESEGEPQVSYERAEEPEVVFQQSDEGPQVRVERMEESEDARAAGEQDQAAAEQQDQAAAEQQDQAASEQQDQAATEQQDQAAPVQASELTGTTLVNDQGEEIGTVEQVVFTEEDERTFLIVSTGGFLGAGEKEIALHIDDIVVQDNRLVAPDLTEEDVEALPEWDDQVAHRELEPDQTAELDVRN